MLSLLLALAAAVQTDAINSARQAYSTCLRDYMRASLEGDMAPDTFEAALATQCTDRAGSFRTALIDRDVRSGGNRARAEEDANMTMDDMRANTVERFRDEYSVAHPEPAETPEPAPAEPAAPTTPQTPQ